MSVAGQLATKSETADKHSIALSRLIMVNQDPVPAQGSGVLAHLRRNLAYVKTGVPVYKNTATIYEPSEQHAIEST